MDVRAYERFSDTYEIYQLNPLLEQQEAVYTTTFTGANGLAFDTARDLLLFLAAIPPTTKAAGCSTSRRRRSPLSRHSPIWGTRKELPTMRPTTTVREG